MIKIIQTRIIVDQSIKQHLNGLQEHVQNVDPNLAKLAEAYQTAAEKLKEDADAFMNGSKSEPLDAAKDDIDMLEQLLGDGEYSL